MDAEKIKNLLTEEDFKLILDGLDTLPSKHLPSEMLTEMMSELFDKNAPPLDRNAASQLQQLKAAKERKKQEADRQRQAMIEDIRVLQGKLIQFKRFLIIENLMGK